VKISTCDFLSQKNRKIYIFGGQRGKENCADFIKYDVDSSTITSVQTSSTEPEAAGQSIFTGPSFSSIDVDKGEVFALLRDSLWIFSLATSEWSMIYKNTVHSCATPEFFVYDSVAKRHFLVKNSAEICLELTKPSRENIFNYCKYLIRKQNYEEITHTDSINALMFLRKNLAETIDQSDIEQVNDFHKLASLLFCNDSANKNDEDKNKTRQQRSALFNKLIELLPESKCQPRENLCNFISI
jgi:muskelin